MKFLKKNESPGQISCISETEGVSVNMIFWISQMTLSMAEIKYAYFLINPCKADMFPFQISQIVAYLLQFVAFSKE